VARSALSSPSRASLTNSLLHEAVVITEVPVISSGGQVAPGEHVVSLHIPADGLPSATDQVRWSVRAVIDRRHGADIKAEAPIEVLAGPERFASEATSDPRYKGERCIDLELSARTLQPGQAITGNVILLSARAIKVTEVVVTFVVTLPVKKGLEGTAVAPPDPAQRAPRPPAGRHEETPLRADPAGRRRPDGTRKHDDAQVPLHLLLGCRGRGQGCPLGERQDQCQRLRLHRNQRVQRRRDSARLPGTSLIPAGQAPA
jgi:hypothetical protein